MTDEQRPPDADAELARLRQSKPEQLRATLDVLFHVIDHLGGLVEPAHAWPEALTLAFRQAHAVLSHPEHWDPAEVRRAAELVGFPPPAITVDRWRVVRQDDHGNQAIVERGLPHDEARVLADQLEGRGHKQHFWIEADHDDD